MLLLECNLSMNDHIVAHRHMAFLVDEGAFFSEVVVQFSCNSLHIEELLLLAHFLLSHDARLEVTFQVPFLEYFMSQFLE